MSLLVAMLVPLMLTCCAAAHALGLLHSAPICTVRFWLAKSAVHEPVFVSVRTA